MAADTDPAVNDNKKVHRQPRAGRKAEKKKQKTSHVQDLTARQRNPKAFAINSAVRAERKFRRHQDIDTKKQHIPQVDRTPLEPPPVVVAIVGPPKVGKSTLIRCLIKNFTRQPLSTIKGPVTVVSGKHRRITLIECNNDINSMLDVAKIADLVFLLIDGSFGFEMEIFEFLNICQVHGMPKIMGILTHLDALKNNAKQLQQTKKSLKHRFWTEVYPGAKLFYLSDIKHGDYLRKEVQRLTRFIAVMKFRPLAWQTTHPYLLADRMEDLTSPEMIRQNPKCDRTICLYGFVRGIPFREHQSLHISGCCDAQISDICFLPDPCPLPEKLKKRSLVEKERLVYAPFSGVGGIVYDKDAVYVELGGSHSHSEKKSDRPEQELFSSLIDSKSTLDAKLAHSELQIFSNAKPITGDEFAQENTEDRMQIETITDLNDGRSRRKVIFNDNNSNNWEMNEDLDNEDEDNEGIESDIDDTTDENDEDDDSDENDDGEELAEESSQAKVSTKTSSKTPASATRKNISIDNHSDEENDNEIKWKTNLSQKAANAFIARQNTTRNLSKLVYDYKKEAEKSDQVSDGDDEEVGGIFKVMSEKKRQVLLEKDVFNAEDCSKFTVPCLKDWNSDEVRDSIRDYFVTGKWKGDEDANELLRMNDLDDDEMFGDFEDLEAGIVVKGNETEDTATEKPKRQMTKVELIEKKRKLKEKFDAEYDDKDGEGGTYYDDLKQEASKQAELNRKQFEGLDDEVRVKLEGYRPGMYVRIELTKMPCELVTNFDPTYPIVVGGLQPGEENVGFVNVRIKKHRWYQKILKTKDPIIISLGWRKFQTLPIYYKLEDDFRQRMLKYTPEHVTCMATFWGPLTKPGTGFLAVQDLSTRQAGFRIIATGTVVDGDQSTRITKKLKLIGEPMKIFRKTAFIKNMFSSAIEVGKFEGAKIKTVSGIRGQIKRACITPEGAFRATFEDQIKLSDIVFCRTWCNVDVPKFYNPVVSLLLPPDEKGSWLGMKTTGQLKRERGIQCEPLKDSLYTPVVRPKKVVKPIRIPKRLQGQLPFKDKPKVERMGPRNLLKKKRIAVIRDRHEQKVSELLSMLRTNYRDKLGRERHDMKVRVKAHKRQMKAAEQVRNEKERERRKKVFIKKTKREARENKK